MPETLLRTNRRAASALCVIAALPLALGALLIVTGHRTERPIIHWTGILLVSVGGMLFGRQLLRLVAPRLALTSNHLLVYLRGIMPWQVPLDVIECFFIGQTPSRLRVWHPAGRRIDNITVVVRLSESAKAWHRRSVDTSLGKWCDGYITVYGTWCEPLNGDVVNRMNQRLAEVKRARKAGRQGRPQ
jgi:hypothetical protein